MAIALASIVLPTPGLAAKIIKSPGWKPLVTLSISLKPTGVPVISCLRCLSLLTVSRYLLATSSMEESLLVCFDCVMSRNLFSILKICRLPYAYHPG